MIKNVCLVLVFISNFTYFTNAFAATSILLLGDSLSASYGMKQNQGWVYLLNQQLTQQNSSYSIINASISGETTSGGLSRFPGILSKQEFDYLIIELGGNDGLRGFPPTLIKNNLLQIIKQAKDKNIPVAIMDIKIPPNYGVRYNTLFESVFSEVANEENIPLLPFFMEDIAIQPSLMQMDGIHPNQLAQPLIAEFVYRQLEGLMSSKDIEQTSTK